MGGESAVRIAALLPDVLGTYSDGGNVTVLAQRLRWRQIPVEICTVAAGDVPPADCDLYVLGGGEDGAQVFAADWLRRHSRLRATLEERAVTMVVCAGLQVLGRWMQDTAGRRHPGADVLDLTTKAGRRRAIGEVVSRCAIPGVGTLTGFENHRGVTTLGGGLRPLAEVVRGVGNGAGDHGDGVLTSTVVGTYLHGPVLARNPALADAVLSMVTGRALPSLELQDQEAVRRLRLGRSSVTRLRAARW
ncbi:MAG: CobB/CobQ domain protein glutamine amidotransferase [Modestobacter sp.]|nr:CobB/CobQ domain protein glutamine amidotransferase [Modestobacter sp.]